MRSAGMNALQGFLLSLFNLASAGEYADLQVIAEDAAYTEIILVTLIANARYLLMSAALSQRFSEKTAFFHRLSVGYGITDELFGIAVARPGFLVPSYYYGALCVAVPGWAFGTAAGIIAGNILPERIVSAFSVALYGMFLAIIIPPARHDRATAAVVLSGFILSALGEKLPFSSGTKTIIFTLIIAAAASLIAPRKEEDNDA